MEAAILRPGATCWKVARANRMAVIIDAATYFVHLKQAILAARHSVLLVGWDFDTRIALTPGEEDDGLPDRLGPLITYVIRRNPKLRVYLLRWDLAFLKMPFRGSNPLFVANLLLMKRLKFRLDSEHPIESCHHQKIVVIDDALAFCGGIDVTDDRWDTRAHDDRNPYRVAPSGEHYRPWHDATTAVDGEAAQALGQLARERWALGTGEHLEIPPEIGPAWPAGLDPVFEGVDVAIARTEPAYEGRREVREIEALYLAAIGAARRTIYLESQYFSGQRIAEALAARLREPDGPELVIINPKRAEGWLEEEVMGSARALLLERLREADRHGRLRFCTPVTEARADIYVHAKVLVVDDRLLRVGSSNINNRSMGVDTECDLAVEARPEQEARRRMILRVRDSLMAEHLGVSDETLAETLAASGGSIIAVLDRLTRPVGRSLAPFEPPALSAAERALAESHLLDPDRPEAMDGDFRAYRRMVTPGRAARMGSMAAAIGGTALLGARLLARRPLTPPSPSTKGKRTHA